MKIMESITKPESKLKMLVWFDMFDSVFTPFSAFQYLTKNDLPFILFKTAPSTYVHD